MATRSRRAARAPLLAAGIVGLLAALWGGLARLGWALPPLQPGLPAAHGPLMVSGFLGVVIGLERAVALDRPWAYAAPLLTALGGAALVVGQPTVGAPLVTLGSLALAAVFAVIVRRHPAPHTGAMALGAVLWLGGNALWLAGWPLARVALLWAGFLVLTIAGERLELARLMRPTPAARAAFLAATGGLLLGLLLALAVFDAGVRVAGAGLLALALWLLRYDIARRTARQVGLTRYIAVCLLTGYVWLGVSGLLALTLGGVSAGFGYDALLHSLFLGFVLAMIFGHAPIIFPAVLGRPMAYRPAFYAHLALLHASLLLRVGADLAGAPLGRQWGGLLNAAALLLFLGNTVAALGRSQRQ